jgi:hypothetical protein
MAKIHGTVVLLENPRDNQHNRAELLQDFTGQEK